MVWPSGDQVGTAAFGAFKNVSCAAPDPSGSLIQISGHPERSDVNATRRPSRENLGPRSIRVDSIASDGSPEAGAPTTGVSIL